MADNIELNAGSGGAVIATDDDGTAQHQYVKIEWGPDNTQTKVNTGASALPIQDGGNTITVDGTVVVTGVATEAKQPALGTAGTASADVITVQGIASMTALKVDGSGVTQPVSGTFWQATQPVSLASVPSHAVTNAGTFAVQVDGSALTALQKIDDPVLVDDAAFTPATSSVMMAGFQADESSTDSVNEGDAGAGRMTLDRKLIVTPQPHSAGGLSIFRSLDLDESEEEVSSAACSVYGAWVTNTATSTRWLKFYNATAASTTVGTTTPVITIGIPGNTSDDISANFGPGGMGVSFGTALSVAATTGVADSDTGAPAANDIIVNIFYKA
mgnify:CR=1 FL=1